MDSDFFIQYSLLFVKQYFDIMKRLLLLNEDFYFLMKLFYFMNIYLSKPVKIDNNDQLLSHLQHFFVYFSFN